MIFFIESNERATTYIVSTIMVQLLYFGILLLPVPSYIIPLIRNPIAQTLMLALLGWNTLGLTYLFVSGYSMWKSFFVALVFMLPLMSVTTLGPAIVTLMNPLGGTLATGCPQQDMPLAARAYPTTACTQHHHDASRRAMK